MERELLNSLMGRVASRDKAAFEAIYRHFVPKLRSFMARSSNEPAVVEEYVQEAMVTVWRKAHLFDPSRGHASTWIFAIARNLRIDAFRRGPKPDFDPADPLLAINGTEPPDELVLRSQQADALREAMKQLKPDFVEVLRMSYFEGLPHGAIAEKLGLPLGTVKSRIRLACEKLRAALGDL
ncbi:sigma-70 family RNA polymerase sigma factor [Rhizobium grahamii]|uniref:RNA polymerase ECF-type sigma factor n=3 Tax=Rhizobium grahamii TaxID=1120045 RepID=S3HC83_9HYPH|nr:sigma-70 family RNA polymerase sigma factor [Rhizobium grahamii]EPE96224.1 RNA polymerase ECF-type sigma factor [Rhizobium grahamii CCGE 502]RDJ03033.1 RNA polymerase subunit sigma [Rhizobium grahamii]